MYRAHALRFAGLVAFVCLCLSCFGEPRGAERQSKQRAVTVTGEGACRTVMLEADGTSSTPVEPLIDPAQPLVGYFPRTPEIVWWHARGVVDGHGHVDFVADEGSGSFDIVADANQTIRVTNESAGIPATDRELHIRSLSLTWTVQYNPIRTASLPPTIGIRMRVSPFPDGGLNRCIMHSCSPATGPILCSPLPEGTPCADMNICNGDETCDGEGACRPAANLAAGTSCSDGNECDGAETCNGSGLCVVGTPLTAAQMDDGIACTTDSCDPAVGSVQHEPTASCVVSSGDLDGDDMPDDWELAHGLDPYRADGFEDADGDRYPNVFEHALGTDPSNPASFPAPTYVVNGAGGGTHTTVKAAVLAADAQNGAYQIIGIAPGVYTGNDNLRGVTVESTKPKLLVIGLEGAGKTVIDGAKNSFGWLLQNSVVVASLTFRDTRLALLVDAPAKETRFVDLLVRDNVALPGDSAAPGLQVTSAAKTYIVGSTFLDNKSPAAVQQIYIGAGAASLANTVVWGSASGTMLGKATSATLKTDYCLVKGQTLAGANNLGPMTDPKLRSDARLRSDSPLRGAGGAVAQSRIDIDGELRPSSTPDIGVDQFVDSDGDGLPDSWEVAKGGNATSIAGAGDDDGDGLTNAQEYNLETDWLDPDSDHDGITDGLELTVGTSPRVADADELTNDLNQDGVIDGVGAQLGYQPNQMDDDGDSISNADELLMCTNPLRADTDGDGVPDNTDAFPLDPLMSLLPANPQDVTPPVITLTSPWNAIEQ